MDSSDCQQTDIAVIGAGPGGYAAAFEAADRGMDVTLISDESAPGGACLHRGCIPSKALLHVAALIEESKKAADWGVTFDTPKIDIDRLRTWKSDIVANLTKGVVQLCKSRKVRFLQARARFVDSHTLQLTSDTGQTNSVTFRHAILATGATPVRPAAFDIGDPRVVDSAGALELAEIPKRLLVVGGGYIGLELGTVYASLGAQVTVVEMTAGLLPGMDPDLVRPMTRRAKSLFEQIHLKTTVTGLTADSDSVVAELQSDGVAQQAAFDSILVAIGRRPNSASVGLDATRVAVDERGFVKINLRQQTDDPAILAIGDVAGEPMLAHKATRQAKVAIGVLAGETAEYDGQAVPAVCYTSPEIACCGVTEREAREAGRQVKVTRFPWAASGRAQTLGRTDGLTKLVLDPETGRVLGVGIVGPHAGELIAEGVLAVRTGATARDLADTIHAHPTLSETVMESAETFFGSATHLYRPKR